MMDYKNVTKAELIKAYESNLKLVDELQEANTNLSKRCVKLDKEIDELNTKYENALKDLSKSIYITSGYKKLVDELTEVNDELTEVNEKLQAKVISETITKEYTPSELSKIIYEIVLGV